MVFLKWMPLDCQIEAYILETRIQGEKEHFTRAYVGADTSHTVNGVPYGGKIIARLKAMNRAGTGAASEEIEVSMPEGKTFLLTKSSFSAIF